MWNYRVIEFVDPSEGPWQAIHEVHYTNDGTPETYADDPANLVAFDDAGELRSLRWILLQMQEALDKPVLVQRDFGTPNV